MARPHFLKYYLLIFFSEDNAGDGESEDRREEKGEMSLHNSIRPQITDIVRRRWDELRGASFKKNKTKPAVPRCRFDYAVTTPGPCAILSHPACHLPELFHGTSNANIEYKDSFCL